jgi:hypothetical protein
VVGYCEYNNGPSGSKIGGELHCQISDCSVLKKEFEPWSSAIKKKVENSDFEQKSQIDRIHVPTYCLY